MNNSIKFSLRNNNKAHSLLKSKVNIYFERVVKDAREERDAVKRSEHLDQFFNYILATRHRFIDIE